MARKFLKLIENTIERYSNGGLLTGDLVKLASNYKSKDGYKNLSDQEKEYIDNYFDTDNNYYVINIKTSVGTQGPGNNDNRGDSFKVEVARELANGIDTGINRHPVPDSQRYDNKVKIKPEEVDEEEFLKNNNSALTNPRVTQQDTSIKPTELTNAKQNTKIPSSGAVNKSNSIGNYTSQYMG